MEKLTFKPSNKKKSSPKSEMKERIKVIIADDEEEVHVVTRFVLKDYEYQGRKLEFLSAYSGNEAKALLQAHADAALILLDIVMEQDDSGLHVAKFIRENIKNKMIRIILRTGQPGLAPEEEVTSRYDVNDYKEKTELTDRKFKTAVTMALRSHSDIVTIDSFRAVLEQKVLDRTAELHEKNSELERLNKELEFYATTDILTGIYNRMKFNQLCDAEMKRCCRYNHPLTLIMADIDHFKSINDRHGHPAGDAVLRELATLVSKKIRSTDIFARWGGEEFILLLPETTQEEALTMSEKLRSFIEHNEFSTIGTITCSFGVAQFLEGDGFESLNRRADEALYEAKRNGRNQVVCK